MREIKFRAWTGKTMQFSGDIMSAEFQDWHEMLSFSSLHNDDKTALPVMQYTGLKDKNGKDVYEGDIIKCPITNESADYLQLEANKKDFVIRQVSIPEIYQEGVSDTFEIIGNIYENN